MITLENDRLVISFPEVHPDAHLRVAFERTLRIPDDGRSYPLPPGLGHFPLSHVDDHATRLPESWLRHGGVFLPMYQAEALWIRFETEYPMAVLVAAGKINAVTGKNWEVALAPEPQSYLVVPAQPWLDGFCVQKGMIRQFVAMPLGGGYTAEGQITGKEEVGGLQILVYPMWRERYEALRRPRQAASSMSLYFGAGTRAAGSAREMGLAPGGLMRQHLARDLHGIEAWNQTVSARCFVHLADSLTYRQITGQRPPTRPITAQDYNRAGLPWFELYGDDEKALAGSTVLGELDSVASKALEKGEKPLENNESVIPKLVLTIKTGPLVREGQF